MRSGNIHPGASVLHFLRQRYPDGFFHSALSEVCWESSPYERYRGRATRVAMLVLFAVEDVEDMMPVDRSVPRGGDVKGEVFGGSGVADGKGHGE